MDSIISFLGAGNMGSAIISAFLDNQFSPENIRICDKNSERLMKFSEQGILVSENPEEVIADAKYIFLAVKPQDAKNLLLRLQGSFSENAVLISIAAGLSLASLQESSGLQKVIRTMPNLPAVVKMGVTGIFSAAEVSEQELQEVTTLLESFGVVISCQQEGQIDAITALSGSGPGYFFRILEIMKEKAEEFGFSSEDSRNIILETLRGSGELAKTSGKSFAELREQVTSKGGTTEAALKEFSEQRLENTIKQGISKALLRAQELS